MDKIQHIISYFNKKNYDDLFLLFDLKEDYTLYFKDHYHISVYKQRLLFLLEKFGINFWKDKTILDLGSGFSVLGHCFSILGSKVTAVEGRQEIIIIGKKLYPEINFINYNLEKEYKDKTYDIVFSFDIFDHIQNTNHITNCLNLSHNLVILDCRNGTEKNNIELNSWDYSISGATSILLNSDEIETILKTYRIIQSKYEIITMIERITTELDKFGRNSPNKYTNNEQRSCWVITLLKFLNDEKEEINSEEESQFIEEKLDIKDDEIRINEVELRVNEVDEKKHPDDKQLAKLLVVEEGQDVTLLSLEENLLKEFEQSLSNSPDHFLK